MKKKSAPPKKATKRKTAKRKYIKNPSLHPMSFDEAMSALVGAKKS